MMQLEGENLLQKNLCTILSYMRLPHFSIPNGSYKRSFQARYIFKVTGLKSGVPDLFVPRAFVQNGKQYHGLFIECKNGKKAVVFKEQREWIALLETEGYYCAIIRDLTEAEKLLKLLFPSETIKFNHQNK